MAVTPSGSVSLPLKNFKTQLSNSSTLQAMVGAANASEAEASIHIQAIDNSKYDRPCALIWHTGLRHPSASGGSVLGYIETGTIGFRIERDISAEYQADGSESDAYLEFANLVGAILTQLEARTDLLIAEIELGPIERTAVSDESAGTFYYSVEGTVRWR